MKNFKVLLLLAGLMFVQVVGYCEQVERQNVSQKIYWGDSSPSAVAAKANGKYSLGSDSPDGETPLFNPIGAYGNMLQMMNQYNSYSGIEMQKQQNDYVKQQVSN